MSLPILPGATSQSVYIKAIDNTTGLAATTVTSATAGLSISYQNTQTGTVTAISLSDLAATNSAWSSGGMKHIAGGVYRLCIPDAAVPATEGARTIISGTATAFQILGCELVGKPVEVVSGSVVVASVSGAVGSVTGAVGSVTGNVGGNVTGSVGSVAMGGITAASIAADAIGASELAADAVAEIQSGLATSSDLATLATYVDTEVAAIKAKTDNLPSDPADQSQVEAAITAAQGALSVLIGALNDIAAADVWTALDDASANRVADHVLRRSWATAAGSADGDALAFRSLLGAVAKLVNRVGIVGDTLTVYEDDDTTALGEQTLTSDADAEPITGVNTV